MTSAVKILVVEDEAIVAKDIASSLEKLGYSVCGLASSGEEALGITANKKPDMVLMDIRLDGKMDGIQTAEIIRMRFNLPVVYLTAYTDNATLERAKLSEPFGYIVKPFEDKDLHVTVEMALYKHKAEKEVERHTRVIEALYTLSKELNTSDSLETLLDKSAGFLEDNPGVLAGGIYLKSENEKLFRLERSFGPDRNALVAESINLSTSTYLEKLVDSYEVMVVDNIGETCLVDGDYSFSQSPKGIISTVLRSGELILGLLVMIFTGYDKHTIGFVETAGFELGSAIRRRAAEDELRVSEERYRYIFELSPEAVTLIGKSGKVLAANRRLEEWLGYSPDEVVQRYVYDLPFLTQAGSDVFQTNFVRRMRGEDIPPYEVDFITKNGEKETGLVLANPLKDEEGNPLADLVLISNITLRKKAEKNLMKKLAYEEALSLCSQFLMEMGSIDNALTSVCEEILAVTNASRVQIYKEYEDSLEGPCIQLVYESVTKGLEPQINLPLLKRLPYNELGEHFHDELLVSDFYGGLTKDLPEPQQALSEFLMIKSILIIPIRVGGNIWGAIWIIDSINERIWERDDLHLVQSIASMIGNTSERKRAEKDLRDSEERYRSLVENINDALFHMDKEGVITYMSPAIERMFKYRTEDIVGKPFSNFIHPEDLLGVNEIFRHILAGGVESYEFRVVDKDGSICWVRTSSRAILYNGQPVGITGVLTDITERKKAEEALQKAYKSREELEQIINQSEAIIFLWRNEEHWPVEFVSDNIRLYGYSPEDWYSGKVKYADIVHPDDLERVTTEVMRYSEEGRKEFSQEYRVITKRGAIRWVDDRTLVRRDVLGNITHYQGIVVDITERKKAEDALRDSKERLKATLDALPDILFEVDREGVIYDFRAPREDLLYLPPREFLGRTVRDVIPHEAADVIMGAIAEAVEKGSHTGAVYSLEMPKGTSWFELSMAAKGDPQSPDGRLIVTARDITERKNAEKALQESEEKLRAVVETANQAIISADSKGRIISWNPAAERIYGYTFDETLGSSPAVLMPDRFRGKWMKAVEHAVDTGKLRHPMGVIETTGLRKDGTEFPMEISFTQWEVGGERFFTTFMTDITDRKKAEEALRKERDKAQKYLDVAGVMLLVLGRDSKVKMINKKGCEILGYKEEEIIGKNWFEHFLPESIRKTPRKMFDEILAGKADLTEYNENPVLNMNGEERIIAWHNSDIMNEEGEVIGILSSGEDITERKKAELKEKEYLENVMFLSRSALNLVELAPSADVYSFLAKRLKELVNGGFVIINSFDEESQQFVLKSLEGDSKAVSASFKLVGRSVLGASFPITEDARKGLTAGKLVEVTGGLFELSCGGIPQQVCRSIEHLLGLGKIYAMGFASKEKLYGSAIILLHHDKELSNKQVVETFISQASVALQRKIAEGALAESEKQYRTLVETLQEGLGVVDPKENIVFANPSFCEMLGYSRKELVGKNVLDIIPRYQQNTLLEQTADRKKGLTSHYELEMIRKDGEVREVRISAVPLTDEKGVYGGSVGLILDITEQKRAEKALRESEERYRVFTEEALVGVYIYGKGHYLFVNQAMSDITGYPRDKLLSIDPFELGLPGDRNSLDKKVGNGFKSSSEYTLTILRKGGEKAIVEVRVRSIPYGDKVAYLGNCIDITDRVRQKEQLEQAKKEWEHTFDAISDMVMMVDLKGQLLKVNRAVIKYTGFVPVELQGRYYIDVFHLTDGNGMREFYLNALRSNHPASYEIKDTTRDNEFWVSASPLIDAGGNHIATVCVARDITQMRRMERALVESEMQFRGLAESAKDIIFNIDADGSILYLNPAMKEIMGYDPSQFIGVNVKDLIESPFGAQMHKILTEYMVHKQALPLFEAEIRDDKGKKHVLEFSTQQVSNQIIGIARDVTERKRMQNQLIRASKLSSVGVLAAGLAHQINNPLASIMATSTALNEMLGNDPQTPVNLRVKTKRYMQKMEEQLERTHKIVSSLLDFTQVKSMEITCQDANDIVKRALQFLTQHLSFKDVQVQIELENNLPGVMINREALYEAIVNVVQNAYEAMNGRGKIVIRSEVENEKNVRIAITNDGPSVPPDLYDEIFELLFTTKTDRKGTGLGLPVASMLLEHFGGRIYLEESVEGQTTFVIEIPIHSKE